jgi:hypothetical protein
MILARGYPTKMVNYLEMGERTMKNPLDTLWGTVIAGVVLTAVLVVFARNFLG